MLEETQKGQKAKAIEHYEKFLNLWKDADPGFAEVEDAKGRFGWRGSNKPYYLFSFRYNITFNSTLPFSP